MLSFEISTFERVNNTPKTLENADDNPSTLLDMEEVGA